MAEYRNDLAWDYLSNLYSASPANATLQDLYHRWMVDNNLSYGDLGGFFTTETGIANAGDAEFEYWKNPVLPTVTVTGATTTTSGAYTIQSWTTSGSLAVAGGTLDVEYLVVAGGGGGGTLGGAGGGAGGLLAGSPLSLSAATHTITVGAGGAAGASSGLPGSDGSNSSIAALVVATGGGGGGAFSASAQNGRNGGSGGGAGASSTVPYPTGTAGSGTAGQGNNGGAAVATGSTAHGGGGGAGAVGGAGSGNTGGAGGAGQASSITGSSVTYGGGGGGSGQNAAGTGGSGGGGVGAKFSATSTAATAGTDGLGGGGGGGYNTPVLNGGDGGDGIVIIRYLTASVAPFSPLDLAPALWLDASDATTITASSGAVSQWRDKSGNARHVSQGTAAAQPTTGAATINGLNVLSFDGGDVLSGSAAINVGAATVFVVAQETTAVDFAGLVVLAPSSGNDFDQQSSLIATTQDNGGIFEVARYVSTFNGQSVITGSGATPLGVYVGRYGSGGLVEAFSHSNTASSSTRSGTFVNCSSVVVGGRYISGAISALYRLNGRIGEIIVYASTLSNADINKVGKYLADRWGLTWTDK